MKQVLRNKHEGNFIKRYKDSFIHALEGINYALKYEQNMIIIVLMAILVIIFGFIYKISNTEWLFIIIIIGLIASCEMINSSIEAVVDLKTTKFNQLAKIAKDTASGATLILCLTALIGGLIIFIPKMF